MLHLRALHFTDRGGFIELLSQIGQRDHVGCSCREGCFLSGLIFSVAPAKRSAQIKLAFSATKKYCTLSNSFLASVARPAVFVCFELGQNVAFSASGLTLSS